jgi:hypothetical protein
MKAVACITRTLALGSGRGISYAKRVRWHAFPTYDYETPNGMAQAIEPGTTCVHCGATVEEANDRNNLIRLPVAG